MAYLSNYYIQLNEGNPHISVLGQLGIGLHYQLKFIYSQWLLENYKVIIIDTTGEYYNYSKRIGGYYLKVTAHTTYAEIDFSKNLIILDVSEASKNKSVNIIGDIWKHISSNTFNCPLKLIIESSSNFASSKKFYKLIINILKRGYIYMLSFILIFTDIKNIMNNENYKNMLSNFPKILISKYPMEELSSLLFMMGFEEYIDDLRKLHKGEFLLIDNY